MFSKIKFLFSAAFSFLLPLIKYLMKEGGEVLIEAAQTVGAKAEESGGTGTEKKEIAITAFTEAVTAGGYTVATNTINTLIEAAVYKLNNE
jgi:hypothetical protein